MWIAHNIYFILRHFALDLKLTTFVMNSTISVDALRCLDTINQAYDMLTVKIDVSHIENC